MEYACVIPGMLLFDSFESDLSHTSILYTVDMIAAQDFSQYILEKFRSINDVVFVNLYRQEPQGVLDSPVYSGLLLTSKKVLQK
jgi:hypothetical protein